MCLALCAHLKTQCSRWEWQAAISFVCLLNGHTNYMYAYVGWMVDLSIFSDKLWIFNCPKSLLIVYIRIDPMLFCKVLLSWFFPLLSISSWRKLENKKIIWLLLERAIDRTTDGARRSHATIKINRKVKLYLLAGVDECAGENGSLTVACFRCFDLACVTIRFVFVLFRITYANKHTYEMKHG